MEARLVGLGFRDEVSLVGGVAGLGRRGRRMGEHPGDHRLGTEAPHRRVEEEAPLAPRHGHGASLGQVGGHRAIRCRLP